MHNLLVPYREDIATLFPNAPRQGDDLVIPHDLPETTILRRLGIETPAPVLSQYTYTGTRPPFDVQKITVEMLTMNARAYVLSSMGTGKTSCPLWAFDYLRSRGHAKRMLIVAPLSSLHFTWMREIFEIQVPIRAVVLHGNKATRLKRLAGDHDAYIINHDGIETIFDELMKRTDIDTLVIDELAVYRNGNPRTKLMKKLATRFKWVWGMTGSPRPRAPTDVWNQANIVTPNTIPKYFGRFREQTMVRINNFKWMPKKDADDRVYEVLQPSVRFSLEDVREIPGYISRRIDVDLGAKQKHIYETIRKSGLALVDPSVAGSDTISAVNAGVLLNKLLQISLGYVYSDTKGIVTLDNKARIQALLDIIVGTDGQLLVFAPFKHALAGIHAAITHANFDCSPIVSGDTSLKDRGVIFTDFQRHNKYKVLLAHPQCLAHSITLTAASTAIWFGPITSAEIYNQANHRIRRTGQSQKQQFLHLQGTTVEKKLYGLLQGHLNAQDRLLSLFEDEY